MKKRLVFLLSLCLGLVLSTLLAAPTPSLAQDVRPITWNDLLEQTAIEFDDPFAALSEEQLYQVSMIARYRLLRQQGKAGSNTPSETEREYLATLQAQSIDVDWLLAQRERVMQARKQQLSAPATVSGERVAISGYVLPLTQKRQRVTEFLLVPWLGACIHTPPPPPNQIVHVTFPQGMAVHDRFDPMTIAGLLDTAFAYHELFLVDGSRDVGVTYTLAAEAVTAYVPGETDPLSQVVIPEEALAGQHFWQRWQTQVSLLFTNTMADIQGQPLSRAFLIGVVIAFAYGVIHTLGPGHGKAVIVSYFVGEGGSLQRGLWMGVRIAVLHVLAAVVLVVATDVVVQQVGGSAAGNFRIMRLVSYGAIASIGGWMLWQALRTYRNAAPLPQTMASAALEQTPTETIIYPRLSQAVLAPPPDKTIFNHTANWGCSCLSCLPSTKTGTWLSMAVGAVPCSGALIVLLYGLANNMLWVSVTLVVAISVGMAIALSTVGVLALLGRQTLDQRLLGSARQRTIAAGLRLMGAIAVFSVGLFLFVVTLAPTA
ncbi:MAG: DUF3299 domain-containing protein [Leptolyngbyaceae cyanobacterium]